MCGIKLINILSARHGGGGGGVVRNSESAVPGSHKFKMFTDRAEYDSETDSYLLYGVYVALALGRSAWHRISRPGIVLRALYRRAESVPVFFFFFNRNDFNFDY